MSTSTLTGAAVGTAAGTGTVGLAPRTRRVRHQARETAALMAFSAVASSGTAVLLLLLVSLGR